VPPEPLIVPLVRLEVEKAPPRFTVPPLAATIVPVLVQVVVPVPTVRMLEDPVASRVPLLVIESEAAPNVIVPPLAMIIPLELLITESLPPEPILSAAPVPFTVPELVKENPLLVPP